MFHSKMPATAKYILSNFSKQKGNRHVLKQEYKTKQKKSDNFVNCPDQS